MVWREIKQIDESEHLLLSLVDLEDLEFDFRYSSYSFVSFVVAYVLCLCV